MCKDSGISTHLGFSAGVGFAEIAQYCLTLCRNIVSLMISPQRIFAHLPLPLALLYCLYYICIGLPLFILCTVLTCVSISASCALGFGRWGTQHIGCLWGRLSLWLHFCPVHVEGLEHLPRDGAPVVVVANHQSAFDIFLLYGYVRIPFRWVLKEGLRRMPFIGWTCQRAGFIFVDDASPHSIAQTMERGREVLAEGSSIFIFPEGSRTSTGRLMRFKKGAFAMASELDVPVLPVTIEGAYEVLPTGEMLARPGKIRLIIHPSYRVSDYGELPKSLIEASRVARERIASALPEHRR